MSWNIILGLCKIKTTLLDSGCCGSNCCSCCGTGGTGSVRYASKKTGGSTKNTNCKVRPKHRGWKVQDGHNVTRGHILATQLTTRFLPGLNVGFGRNGTLFAIEAGKVVVTCEKFDPKWDHTWVKRIYAGREQHTIFKKYFNVIPEPQHNRFKLIDEV